MNKLAYSLIFASLLFIPIFTADAAVLRTPPNNLGLVGYWSFEDGSGSTATDFSGSGNAGTLTNMDANTDWVAGERGGALEFDGSDDYVDIGDVGVSGDGSRTISGWVKNNDTSQSSWTNIFGFAGGTGGDEFFDVEIDGSDTCNGNGYVAHVYGNQWCIKNNWDVQWHHIVVSYDGSKIKAYYDGQEVINTSYSGLSTIDNIHIGNRQDNSNYWNGLVDEVRIYNRALSASEVRDLYQSGYAEINRTAKVEEVGDPVGWWTFDGRDMDWSADTAQDRAGSNDGTLNGGMDPANSSGPGRIGQALDFGGVDDAVGLPDTNTLKPDPVTVSLWFNAENPGDRNELYKYGNAGYTTGVSIDGSGGSVSWQVGDGSGVNLSDEYDGNTWVHAAGTASNGLMQLYINGTLKSTTTYAGPIDWSSTGFRAIGAKAADGEASYVGKIDDVRIYDKALSADEIQKIYNATRPSEVNASQDNELTDGLVGLWSFDGPSMDFGTAPPTAADVSSNSNTGTLNGGMASAIGNIGQALEFDGSNDYINIGSVGGSVNTFSFWTKPTKDNQYITQLNGSTNIQISSGSIQANGFSSPTIYVDGQNTSSVTFGEWNHVTVTTSSGIDATATKSGIVEGAGGSTVSTPSHNNTSDSGSPQNVSDGDSITFSHDVSGSDRLLIVGASESGSGGSSNISSVTYAGNNLTKIASESLSGFGSITNTMWFLDSPPTGANDVVVNYGGTANNVEITASSFTQANGVGATTTNDSGGTAANISTTITPESANSIVLDGAYIAGDTAAGANQTVRWSLSEYKGSTKTSSGSDMTMSWEGGSSSLKTHILTEILPASGSSNAYFSGKLDNMRMYDRVLSQNEIKRLYRLGQ